MAEETITLLDRLGVPVDPARVSELAAGAVVTRPHIARAMVEAGHVASDSEAFDRFLGNGRPAAPERPAPDPATAIATVHAAGGVVGLAHPVFSQDAGWPVQLAHIPTLLDQMVEHGLAAVECYYPDATPAITGQLVEWTRQWGLVATGGSDYHGPGKAPFAEIGANAVDLGAVHALLARRRAVTTRA
jgi:predicted metal-dependent phosphoesterase TrpH